MTITAQIALSPVGLSLVEAGSLNCEGGTSYESTQIAAVVYTKDRGVNHDFGFGMAIQ